MSASTELAERAVRGRSAARAFLIALEALIAIGALYGGIGLIAENAIGMRPDWLDATPFDSWTIPGVLLILVVALPMGFSAVAELRRDRFAKSASMIAGGAQVGWIVAQWLLLQRYFFLQPIMLIAGILVLVLAWWAHRSGIRAA